MKLKIFIYEKVFQRKVRTTFKDEKEKKLIISFKENKMLFKKNETNAISIAVDLYSA